MSISLPRCRSASQGVIPDQRVRASSSRIRRKTQESPTAAAASIDCLGPDPEAISRATRSTNAPRERANSTRASRASVTTL